MSLVAEASATAAATVPTGREEDVLYAAKFQIRPRMGVGSAVHSVLAALGAAIARDWQDAPPLTRDRALSRPPGRFHGLRWETNGEESAWAGELVWRHPHPVISGAPCTTHLVLAEHQSRTTLTIRVTADAGLASVRGTVGAGQARPEFLTELNRTLRLVFDGADCEPRVLQDSDIEAFVEDVLLSETRDVPIAVLSPFEEGGYAVPPLELAEELLGLAHLYTVDRHPATFRLSDALGDRRLSCYWGALRVYMPEFSCADRPDEHPLLFRDRVVDPVIRADLVGKLGRFARLRVAMPSVGARRRPADSPPRDDADTSVHTRIGRASATVADISDAGAVLADATSAAAAHAATAQVGTAPPPDPATPAPVSAPTSDRTGDTLAASMQPLLLALGARLGELSETITHLVDANTALASEIARMRTTNAVRAVNTTSLERRIGSLEQLLVRTLSDESRGAPEARTPAMQDGGERADDDDSEKPTLLDALRQAATSHPDALLVLDAAERSATESPYEDIDRLAVILDAMASVARRRQEGTLGTSLRDAFRELGIDYRGGISAQTSDRHLQQYIVRGPDGRAFECREHIALGTSYDPRHCLRIYFTSRAPVEPRFVIGHVGRHFDVLTTS